MLSHSCVGFMFLALVITITFGFGTKPLPDYVPQQIHLSYGSSPTEMRVTWASGDNGRSTAFWGVKAKDLSSSVRAHSYQWELGNPNGTQWVHRASMKGLTPGQLYYYRVQTDKALSPIFAFKAMRQPSPDWIPRFLMFGDLGKDGGGPSLDRMIAEVSSGNITAVIHAGDFAYDLSSYGGALGSDFMRMIEPMAAYVPYMTCPGNHEIAYNFSNYLNTFNMPTNSPNPSAMWYSWDINNIHFVSYDTEVYFISDAPIQEQYDWLESDLIAANKNRANVPWIIAFGHRPMYCSNLDQNDCTRKRSKVRAGLEELFFKYGVDLIIEAHEHSYERLWPVYNETVTQYNYTNPLAPVHIISGAAGCNELLGVCVNPILRARGPWSAYRSWFMAYGYGHLEVHNSTHLYWDEILDTTGEILDSIWIVQEKHGPFQPLAQIIPANDNNTNKVKFN